MARFSLAVCIKNARKLLFSNFSFRINTLSAAVVSTLKKEYTGLENAEIKNIENTEAAQAIPGAMLFFMLAFILGLNQKAAPMYASTISV